MTDDSFCPSCGEILPILGEQVAMIDDLQGELAVARVAIRRLRGQQSKQAAVEPYAGEAQRVYEYWIESPVGKGARTFGDDRRAAVLARLREGHTAEEMCRAIDGAAAKPYKGRTRTDLSTICRNERNLLMFLDFAEQAEKPASPGPATRSASVAAAGPPVSQFENATIAKHEAAEQWRHYADDLKSNGHKREGQRIANRALLLDTNTPGDPQNAALLREMRAEMRRAT